jgi:RNA polymerase sigma-70 factor (ECF subfamily)
MDSEYIRKVLQGDSRAFRYFIDKYRNLAYSLAISIVKNSAVAEEVTQDAFVNAYKSLHKFEERAKFSTWLYKIVMNESLKRVKRKTLDYCKDIEEIHDTEISHLNESIDTLSDEDQRYFINRALDRLSPNDSLVLRLFYLQESTLREIQEITGLTETNIKSILHRARKRMYAALQLELKEEIRNIL